MHRCLCSVLAICFFLIGAGLAFEHCFNTLIRIRVNAMAKRVFNGDVFAAAFFCWRRCRLLQPFPFCNFVLFFVFVTLKSFVHPTVVGHSQGSSSSSLSAICSACEYGFEIVLYNSPPLLFESTHFSFLEMSCGTLSSCSSVNRDDSCVASTSELLSPEVMSPSACSSSIDVISGLALRSRFPRGGASTRAKPMTPLND